MFESAEARLHSMEQLTTELPWPGSALLVAIARATLAEARDDPNGMWEAVSPLLRLGGQRPSQPQFLWPWLVVTIDALVGVGQKALARRVLARLESIAASHPLGSARVDIARLHGRIAEADHDLESARRYYECAVDPAGPVYPVARALLAHGRLLVRAGERRAAVVNLRRARESFGDLKAEPDIAACDRELVACGVLLADGSGGLKGLTAAEITVASLVAQGLSNRDVAARLYVTPKAVEYHLSHIYAKLGIRSRRQLVSVVPRDTGDDESRSSSVS
jgi:DNA-binding CsgD family transcriptional regulator